VTRRRTSLLCAALGLLLAGCGSSGGIARATAPPLPDTSAPPTATPSPSPTAQPTSTATPASTPSPSATPGSEGGVVRVPPDDQSGDATVAADLYPSSGSASCPNTGPVGYGACPVTSRLADRLNQHPVHRAEQLCRCQNKWQGVTIKAPTVLPVIDTYTVEVDLQFGASAIDLDVIVLRTADGWFADDIRCHGGGASTSIYAAAPPPC
jgi:hypothetical protein